MLKIRSHLIATINTARILRVSLLRREYYRSTMHH